MNSIKLKPIESVSDIELKTSYLDKNHENQIPNIYSNIFDDIKDERWAEVLDVK